MKNCKFWLVKAFALLGIILLLGSCEKENDRLVSEPEISDSVKQKIASLGFDPAQIKDAGDCYLVEGDILLQKGKLDSYVPKKSLLKQAQTTYLVNLDKVHNITVRVDASIPTSGDDNWRTEVQQAITEWNNTSSNIHLVYTTAPTADVNILSDGGSLADRVYYTGGYYWVLAAAEFPTNIGNPGYRIRINLDTDNNRIIATSQKKYNIVHELGHCLGLRHTNWYNPDPQQCEPTAIGITGTPNTGTNPDPNSVMNGGTALNSWVGFSNYDLIAVRTLYPNQYNFSATISGPTKGTNSGTYTWSVSAAGGTGILTPYTFYWEYSYDDTTWRTWSTKQSITGNMPLDRDLYLRVTVTSANGYTCSAERLTINTDATMHY